MNSSPALERLSQHQTRVAMAIIRAALVGFPQLMLLKSGAGTGTTHTVRALMLYLTMLKKHYLICDATGIAVAQYAGEQTAYSVFPSAIDKNRKGGLRSNIEKGSAYPRRGNSADLIILDEVSMLTP
jgi:hypothetical protein